MSISPIAEQILGMFVLLLNAFFIMIPNIVMKFQISDIIFLNIFVKFLISRLLITPAVCNGKCEQYT